MKRLVLLFLALLGLCNPSWAVTTAYQFETLTITTSTVVGFTGSKLISRSGGGRGGTTSVFCTTETDDVRFRVDGSSPTASVGHKVQEDTSLTLTGYENVRAARFLGVGSASAVWQCTFEAGDLP